MYKRSIWFCLPLFWLVVSCGNSEGVAERKINQEKMVQILADIHIADAYAEEANPARRDVAFAISEATHAQVLRNYKIERAKFDETYTYYTQHPDQMDVLYEKVIQEITNRELKIK